MKNAGIRFKEADSSATITNKHTFTAITFHDVLTRSDYVEVFTHGRGDGIFFFNENLKETKLTVEEIRTGPSLKGLKVCFVAACASYNAAMAMQKKGATTTIGYGGYVNTTYNARMVRSFNKNFISKRESVAQALYHDEQELAEEFAKTDGVKHCEIYGDKAQFL